MQRTEEDRLPSVQAAGSGSASWRWLWAILIVGSVIATPIIGSMGGFSNGGSLGVDRGLPEYFLPAGYTFSIWSVIYIGLAALGIWLALPAQADNVRVQRAAPWLAATAALNVVWILLAGIPALTLWTVPAIIVMEVLAWIAYFRLDIVHNANLPRIERILHVPVQIYVGWLSVATVANITSTLTEVGWNGWGIDYVVWGVIMLIAATVIAAVVGWLVHDNIYRGVFVWAFIGIVVEQAGVPVIAWTAGILAGVITLIIVVSFMRGRRT